MIRATILISLLFAGCTERSLLAREPANEGGTSTGDDASLDAERPKRLCDALVRLPSVPSIDGVLERDLVLETISNAMWTDRDPLPPGTAFALAVAWHEDGLYFYAEIADATRAPSVIPERPWCGDAVHLFADDDGRYAEVESYDDPGTMQLIVRAPRDADESRRDGSRFVPEGPRGAWSSSEFGSFGRSWGYVVEAFVRGADLDLPSWRLRAGARAGFDLSVSVSGVDTDGTEPADCLRIGDVAYRDASDGVERRTPHRYTTAFCNPVLLP